MAGRDGPAGAPAGSGATRLEVCIHNIHSMMEHSRNQHNGEEEELVLLNDSSLLSHQLGRDLSMNCLIRCSRFDYATLALLNKDFHSLIKSGLLYRLRRKANIVEYWVYYSCSHLEWEAFDPNGGRWMKLPKMPLNEFFQSSDKESLAVGTELLVFGRDVMSPIIYKYNILTNIWSLGMSMNTPRCLFASASHHELAFIAGGCDPMGNILSSAELYNSETEKFEILPSMNKARKLCSGFFMDGKFYVIGGIGDGDMMQLTCGEEFNPITKTWKPIPDMLPRRIDGVVNVTAPPNKAPPLVAVANNILYAADYGEQVVRRYEKEQNSWVIVGGLPERMATVNGWGLAFRACGDNLIFIGGVGGRMVKIYSCIPQQGEALQWNLLASNESRNFVFNCTVMGC
ncbi:F-box/kelch-repeat protein At1g74510-like [Neltuma alba]|uniref:F-box/kelch-repeat protein At1g74510-like n=1 Tax=Neltuma alba TaxID=207710 RepID=UPI0010A35A9D|nr:F-box/kelch-repeat protein At1g74510-like [Prosopis alba]